MAERLRAVVGIVEKDGQVLIGKKKETPEALFSGVWHLPGGRVKRHERYEDAMRREIQEETGIKIRINALLAECYQEDRKTKVKWYLCTPEDLTKEIIPSDDLDEVKFVSMEEVFSCCDPQAIELWPPSVVLQLSAAK